MATLIVAKSRLTFHKHFLISASFALQIRYKYFVKVKRILTHRQNTQPQ